MAITANVKQKLAGGHVSFGSWLRLGSPAVAEVMARMGFDWLIIEGEHAAADMATVQAILQAMNGTDTVPILRVPWNDPVTVKVALDVGVKGIMFPMVNSRQEAEDAVRACRYPPEGVRGLGPGRATLYGLHRAEYLREANEDLLIYIIIEHDQAVRNVDEIVSVPGIDGAFFGYSDYAASIGLTGQTDHPRVHEARRAVLAATRRAGIAAAYAAGSVEQARQLVEEGFRLVTVSSDAGFIGDGARAALTALT